MSASSSKKIVLVSEEGENVEMSEAAVRMSPTLSKDIDNGKVIIELVLKHNILLLIKKFCEKHVEAAAATSKGDLSSEAVAADIKSFEADFVKLDQQTLFCLVPAAGLLKIERLEDLAIKAVADIVTNVLDTSKTVEEARKMLNVENDFCKEEEDAIRREIGAWVSEDEEVDGKDD